MNHIPICTCIPGYEGNAFVICSKIQAPVITNPCIPSPCGPNSQCREINSQAVCSCVPGFIGSPPACRPECVSSAECSLNQACVNQKCIDPCPGTCGIGAQCQVVNHNPICSCPPRQSGDPFVRCVPVLSEPVRPVKPCEPSPCGPNAECRVVGDQPSCSCLADFIGTPPNCRPECVSNSECANHLACINQKCRDPCPGTCGQNADCRVISHTPNCVCLQGYVGDPFAYCSLPPSPPPEIVQPCNPSPCGANAVCKEQNNAGSCTCLPEYIGNPYEGCRPECVLNSDCPSNKACIRNKCQDPCPGTCGQNANCQVINHLPSCTCIPGYTGDPFTYCSQPPLAPEPPPKNIQPCQPSPCGPNSQCREVNEQAVCSCLPNYIGNPPQCRPECVVSSECARDKACINQRCADPCPGSCGLNAKCEVINHSPICSCSPRFTGDPFTRCYPIPVPPPDTKPPPEKNPCIPSPCGPNSECRDIGGAPSCSCLTGYFGNPPNCRPECTVNSDCSSNLACIRQKCTDPCPGSCGFNAKCDVINHTPICACLEGYTGDPFTNCILKPREPEPLVDKCNPSPCGSNAQCDDGVCTCLPEYQGDPYRGCRPECVLNSDCPRDRSCINSKCKDPCPGTCGQNAECSVINHIPMCSCIQGYIGNAFVLCTKIPEEQPKNPCSPSPCGPNSQCREINGQAVCSCVPGFIGSPPTCRPECVTSSECPLSEACVNQKCIDPCPGTCGINTLCQVINHNPICSCRPRYSGDPFVRCQPIVEEPPLILNPCQPSPCGPNSQCKAVGDSPSCSCLPDFIGSPPNCKPECISNSECSNHLACINQKCKDPCPGVCGQNAECKVVSHTPNCVCLPGYIGDPFAICNIQSVVVPPERPTPCLPSPCGSNAECRERNGAGSCVCLPEYIGNPYEGCRPECVLNSDCPSNKACVRNKCIDPCPGTCGQNAECQVINHLPSCTCTPGYTGDPFRYCSLIVVEDVPPLPQNPCQPSPCGPNSQCREINEQAVCSCLPEYIGSPPGCRPECTVSSECPQNRACLNQKCVDPCPGTCGLNADCKVINHSPVCSCRPSYTGDPFTRCYSIPPPEILLEPTPNPCVPSPCGPNSQCRDIGNVPSCSCLPNYVGNPPSCRPECTINSECSSNLACIQEKCRDPCPGSCGTAAQCSVINHTPICTCIEGYTGDPFTYCQPKPPVPEPDVEKNPCNPSPCGANAQCDNGICTCLPEYQGDPYRGCRPECVLNNDCPRDKACVRSKCIDPCPGTCGQNAECAVINHIPTCTCIQGYIGNAFVLCTKIPDETPKNPCSPTPCGPNSQCREINGQAVCSCVPGYIGSPPTCRPECVSSSECALNRACLNQKCVDPCPGTCGLNANCQVVNHNPICSCPPGQTGDPFTRCTPIIEYPSVPSNPCQPSPCGPNSQCREIGEAPSCSCLPEFVGSPPNCRPECVSNSECANHLACINQKCKDPCPGTCGQNAECRVVSHTPNCVCIAGYNGDPFIRCLQIQDEPLFKEKPTPCVPSPCGANAECRERNGAGACTCILDYIGNPYEGCRPECTLNSDCPSNKACIRNKCVDPCPGTCGQNAECQVINHLPSCTCIPGYTGDPFRFCNLPPNIQSEPEPKPCQPSPCGPNSQCREVNGQAVCSCLPTYIGSPPGCRPECTVSSECAQNKACLNQKCVDPCPGTCGLNAECQVINHSPICSCKPGNTGDPFTRCYAIPPPPPVPLPEVKNPCIPSPCGPNSLCRDVGGSPSCSCLDNYIGSPPNCRPECTINSECQSNLACIREKCRDPCPGSCGALAHCSVVNHTPMCTCPEGYTGDPFSYCQLKPPVKDTHVVEDPCNPSPCGPNAQCDNGVCTCLPEFQGDPYLSCRPECVLNNDCSRNLACISNKCKDPCPGTCGQNALCATINHIPTCTCLEGYEGNAFVLCTKIPDQVPTNPCQPSPCGPNSQCRDINNQAVCSCVPGFIGSPPTCRPECVTSTECSLSQACVNQKCIDPCPGTCGLNAKCQTVNHNPICSCPPKYTGDPFTRCFPAEVPLPSPTNPCQPSPCGPNSQCREINGSPSCSCLQEFIGSPPNCRPECVSNSECANHLACINQKCRDPCPGICTENAECRVVSHTPNCVCFQGYVGDPFVSCIKPEVPKPEYVNPCFPSPCGPNAICRQQNGAGSCTCIQDYLGNPYEGCRPECLLNSDCPSNKACVSSKCIDPCPGTCGQNAECQVINHLPSCTCIPGYTGDPFRYCNLKPPETPPEPTNPCQPSPCGPNSQCREVNGQAVCSCLPEYIGSPPGCRPECTVSSECSSNKACINQKCVDPCPGTCGINAKCETINHSPICSCQTRHTGDPFTRCYPIPPPPEPLPNITPNPCVPSPCGPHSVCQDINGVPSCSCIDNYIGAPPNCRPECTINPECSSSLACIREKCRDPCPGSCGAGANCNVMNHVPVCTCPEGYTGDPFSYCTPKLLPPPEIERNLCNPSPCGPNAQCNNGECTCLPEYHGDPYRGCRPECVLNSDCARDKACVRNKCVDPCPGLCGQNAECAVVNHIPTCSCIQGYTGNAFLICSLIPEPLPKNPCNPSPCGPNSQCREINSQAVCSCVPGYIGSPPTCRPECISSTECSLDRACLNQKCIDPCPGTCGINSRCQVVNHNPICSCPARYTGDPFIRCQQIIEVPETKSPCDPSPCGPNAQCREVNGSPSCSCLLEFIGAPPNCRPECVSNSECANHLACINQKCKDPCAGICGLNAECRVVSHTPNCACLPGYSGNPFQQCTVFEIPLPPPDDQTNPCFPSPCGANAVCKERNNAGSCMCLPEYIGNPYEGCRPECVLNSDCPSNRACINNRCADPCPGTCGQNANCQVINHLPSCSCLYGYTGDPFRYCNVIPEDTGAVKIPTNPCQPSPCGPNSQCREVNEQAVCSCLPNYIGSPPGCRPECTISSECAQNRACFNQKCVDPCPGTCGLNARCEAINHSPICSCSPDHTGDPFTRCYKIPTPPSKPKPSPPNPCVPSPCGPYSQCRDIGGNPSCSCLRNYVGSPPNCKPECTINSECSSSLACINEKCKDPCPGSCGIAALCEVRNHNPTCVCPTGYAGDAFVSCIPKPIPPSPPNEDLCYPNPCGPNALCDNGTCTCYPEYRGDPYRECRPECVLNSECPRDRACISQKCRDPCPGTCGQNAECNVFNHYPSCSCLQGYSGDAFVFCAKIETPQPKNPCHPSPCGPNSQCREINNQAVCSCLQGYTGSPPTCRPECVSSSECSLATACVNQKCIDPCPGTCGLRALCQVVNHNPICTCPTQYTGDPFVRCQVIIEKPPERKENPCVPSPCGPNALCEPTPVGTAKCTCIENYIGAPPNCRPECITNSDCSKSLACINQKCRDPCPGSCGLNARCLVVNHVPNCMCVDSYVGDPFTICTPQPPTPPTPPSRKDPCVPSPCGPNAHCRVENDYGVCECLPEYHGNPYEVCRPECLSNADCAMNRACISNKCQDPCPGTCGFNALCTVTNHVPVCSCPDHYTGDAFRLCTPVIEKPPTDPCNPSPCGINTICRKSGENAICECLPGFFGTPSSGGCKPECTISADCARDKACVNTKCVDPCPGVCGFAAICNVINHSPICSCPPQLIGDPFTLCQEQHVEPPSDPCIPSPCNLNGQCRVVNGLATCIYPECVINQDCPRDKACYSQKCKDPCRDACGLNALCQVINHKAVCSCPQGYIGSPEVQCRIPPEEPPTPPKVECTQDSDCTNDKACINTRCVNPCSSSPGICGQNAECHAQLHRAVCSCRDGFTGNAQHACYEIGCRSDSECPPTQACINRECTDPCSFTSCGLNALCRAGSNHKARCYCPDNFRGDPLVRCERPECVTDEECPYNLACRNERCEDPCNCGPGATCRVVNHRAQCSCPPGYTGNPLASCTKELIKIQPQCRMDSDCPSKLACFSGVCKNPCFETKPCGLNAECIVVDSLPLRTMSCMCLPGYVGDADTECKPAQPGEPGCKRNEDCPLSDACLNAQCVNPCAIGNPCALTAQCTPLNHKAMCKCPAGLEGNPFIKCYEKSKIKPECSSDAECSNDKSCINRVCQNPCTLANPCGSNANCQTHYHRPTCNCPDGWIGNPQVECYKPECQSNNDCPYDRSCVNENCVNPCISQSCGRGAECQVFNHRAQCQCPTGTQGDPLLSCITGICHYNEDCADHEACDRLNRVCRPVCDEDTCADTATCRGQQHQPKCYCPSGTTGNPFIKCTLLISPPDRHAECRADSECPTQMACINQQCINPCVDEQVCKPDQECRVLDTSPLRTVMCQCPPDTVVDSSGHCVSIRHEQCYADNECNDNEKCVRGTCIDACKIDRCGVNALCNSFSHQAICTCAPGYTGNAHVECITRPVIPPVILPPECYVDSDCTYDKTCRSGYCVNPCREDNPCAVGAFCSVSRHEAVCRCPAEYIGNPKIECIAPIGPIVGCTSNSECPKSESCINHLCASPCNCGPNAECKVVNHYATCYCQPGYSGNPQLGCVKLGCQSDNECSDDKQCYNAKCVDPCILQDPCARNAECYGNNHKASCRCPDGYEGNPFTRCERIECHSDNDCPNNKACLQRRCVDPCSSIANPPCAQNAICYAQNHAAGCVCPSHLPEGNPLSYCSAISRVPGKPECELDVECPSKLACIRNQCVNPCESISPCHPTAHCSVLDTVPVRTMICTCPEGWVPNESGECHAIIVPIPPGCISDDDCPNNEACTNRLCRNPCDCGANAKCYVQNHRAICSCAEGFEGNPNIACHTVGCRIDSECESGKACINGHCINPCLVKDPCGINAECYVYQNQAECRCLSGYRGNPFDRCIVVGCTSNSDCPSDRQCINAQCINPCIYNNPCSSRAECKVQNHLSLCRCPPGLIGNPYVDCRPEPQPECREDRDCPSRLACLSNKCQNPCTVLEPCRRPSECQVVDTVPLRTMICVCPPGYISSGSGTCNPVTAVIKVACVSDSECPAEKACFNGICKNPCTCGPNAECRVKNHKPVCTCRQGYDGNPELECHRVGCRSDDECSGQHSCINRQCVPVCAADGSSCGEKATCYGYNHRATCECPPGLKGNPKVSCILVGCRSDTDCPGNRACINDKCELPCEVANPCDNLAECKVFNHIMECVCPPGTVSDGERGCLKIEEKCRKDSDCPSQYACIGGECVNPCKSTEPCGINAECTVLDTEPVRTMICQCLPGYQGNAAVQCDKMPICEIRGFVQTPDGECVCPPNTALNENGECVPCPIEKGLKVDERGRCVCALEKGLIIDERGNCVCPIEFGYHLDNRGNCVPKITPKCEEDSDCLDHKFCSPETKTCEDPCLTKHCGINTFCNATNHQAFCYCIEGYEGNPNENCTFVPRHRTTFPRPDLIVSCLSDGVQVEITLSSLETFSGILYVKGHSKDENCRRMISTQTGDRTEFFKVKFGNCGLIHINGEASFVLVIQKHPVLVTTDAQAYHIKCVYQTGEQNVTLGFNVSMLTTAGTIANTGPPPTCLMKIITPTGQEIDSAEIGDNLMLQVDVQPGSIYGGFARSCVAKTMENSIENEYLVTDENGCATDPTIFGEWDYNPDTQSLQASFNAFKFPSSDTIKFQCNIRVCFGKCQPVNCRGYNAFGRRKRAIDSENNTDTGGDLLAGQLREEITIQSNAIITFEKREERGPDSRIAPNAQRVEDICVSMIGFIIALIITALLALVAVAVAVSCWLMAYRRRPKATGPLPHPPEFPNPLFTTPEPMAEPSPDYLT